MENQKTAQELYQMSQDFYHTGWFETSLDWIEKAIVAQSHDLSFFQLRGMILSKLHLYERALQDFDRIIQHFTSTKNSLDADQELHVAAILNRIQIYFQQKNYDGLIQDGNAILQVQRNHWQAFFYRGIGYYFGKSDQQALEDLDMAFYLSNQKDKVRPFRALAYFKQGKYALADIDFEIAVKNKPQDGVLWYNYGLNAYCMQQFEPALERFDQALQADLVNKQVYIYKGKVLQALDRCQEAEACNLKAATMK